MKQKKGVSMFVSYVLLITIAIALAALVYAFLKLYLPSDRAECPADMGVIAEDFSCTAQGQLSLTWSNRGLFNISGVYIRFGASGRQVRMQVNQNETLLNPPLAPGQSITRTYAVDSLLEQGVVDYILELQPAIYADRRLVPCENAVITQPIKCENIP